MGMYGSLRRASAADVIRLRANPKQVTTFLYGEEPVVVTERPRGLLGLLMRITGITVERVQDAPVAEHQGASVGTPAAPGEELGFEREWHGLHFLLTGTAWEGEAPACYVIRGGEDIGEDRFGDPVARLLDPTQVRDFAAFLTALTPEELRRRFDPARMTELKIYGPSVWEPPEEDDEALRELLEAFEALQEFIVAAAAAGDSVVVAIS